MSPRVGSKRDEHVVSPEPRVNVAAVATGEDVVVSKAAQMFSFGICACHVSAGVGVCAQTAVPVKAKPSSECH